jgi:hypothetical protein
LALTSLVVAPVVAAAVAILPLPLLLPAAAVLLSSEEPEELPPDPEEPPLEPEDPLLEPEEPDEPEDPEEPLLEPEAPEDPPPDPDDPLFEFEDPEIPDEPLFEPEALRPTFRFSAEFSGDRFDDPEKPLLDPLLPDPGMLGAEILLLETTGSATVFGIARLALNAAADRSNAAIGVDAVPGTLVREPPDEPDEPPEDPDPPDDPDPPAAALGVMNAMEIKPARTNAARGGNMLLMCNALEMVMMFYG